MEFTALQVAGACVISIERHEDERGFFGRLWDAKAFGRQGLSSNLAQVSLSLNPRRGTLRGMHYQIAPHEEAKLITCVRGSIWDVVLDLRRDSPTFLTWHAETLDGSNLRAMYIPEGCAHGFLTLSDDVLVLYQSSSEHQPGAARGVRWNDPAFGIAWPQLPQLMNARDRSYPDF
jgi:dTDP-4-dehydrorhamnose 3,5-epimerase